MADLIEFSELTQGIEEQGLFDVLMRSVSEHLKEELSSGRITGTNYSTVYLGALQSVLNIAGQTLIQVKVSNAQIEQSNLQLAQIAAQTSLIKTQEDEVKAQITLLGSQNLGVLATTSQTKTQTSLIEKQELEVVAQTNNILEQVEVTKAQAAKIAVDTDQVSQAIIAARFQTEETVDGQVLSGSMLRQRDLLDKQLEQADLTLDTLAQKLITEKAQTEDGYGGNLGAQRDLLTAQKESFEYDRTYKLTAKMIDAWISRLSMDNVSDVASAGLDDNAILTTINKARNAVGLSST